MILQRRWADHERGEVLVPCYYHQRISATTCNDSHRRTWVVGFSESFLPLGVLGCQDADGLQRLAEAHVVTQNAVQLIHAQEVHPVETGLLIAGGV